eukprot:768719-Hanusia_phi.AAC.6
MANAMARLGRETQETRAGTQTEEKTRQKGIASERGWCGDGGEKREEEAERKGRQEAGQYHG